MSKPEPRQPAASVGAGVRRRSVRSGRVGRALLGFVAGFVLMGVAVVSLVTRSVTSDLPPSPEPILDYRSAEDSVLLDGAGEVITQFRLVDVAEPAGAPTDVVVEAFFAASETTFYEARASRATPAVDALRRAIRGVPPAASPLSIELARSILAVEAPGLRRRIREEILATRFDADVAVVDRGHLWLEWIPLCGGRRGLGRAARTCLGQAWSELSDDQLALVAGAAVADFDLRGPPSLLEAHRDAVLDRLVALGRVDPEDSARFADRAPGVRCASGAAAFQERVLMDVRRFARDAEPRSVTASSWLDRRLQDRLGRAGLASWAAVEPTRGAVLAFGGAIDGRGRALPLAIRHAALVRGGGAPQVRFLRKLEVAGRGEIPMPPPVGATAPPSGGPEQAFRELSALPGSTGLKSWTEGNCSLLLHPQLSVAACGQSGPPGLDLVELTAAVVEPAAFITPDGVRLDDAGVAIRR
jgi:hypothetical protein